MEQYLKNNPHSNQRLLKNFSKTYTGGCRWCGTFDLPPRRRTFCSQNCVDNYMIRVSTSYLRNLVFKRDKGICALCGVDTKLIAKKILSAKATRKDYGISEKRKVWKRKNGGGLFDVDHIVRCEHGGGLCGLENLRTLCIACHKSVTY